MIWIAPIVPFVVTLAVADPGFDLREGVDFVNGGEGGVENQVKVLYVEIKVILSVFWPYV